MSQWHCIVGYTFLSKTKQIAVIAYIIKKTNYLLQTQPNHHSHATCASTCEFENIKLTSEEIIINLYGLDYNKAIRI